MFPAPTTIAISTPLEWRSRISSEIRSTSSRSTPYSSSPMRASPDSFSRTRSNAGLPFCSAGKGVPLILQHLELVLGEGLVDRLARVVDPLLVGQHRLAEELLGEHALDDLRADLLGLRLDVGELLQDRPLRREVVLRDLVAVRVDRRREGDVHGEQPGDVLGPAGPHQHADLVRRRVDVRRQHLVVALLLEPCRPTDLDVLAELPDEFLPLLLELPD